MASEDAEAYGFLTAGIDNLKAAIRRMKHDTHGYHGLAYQQAVRSLDAATGARWHLKLAIRREPGDDET